MITQSRTQWIIRQVFITRIQRVRNGLQTEWSSECRCLPWVGMFRWWLGSLWFASSYRFGTGQWWKASMSWIWWGSRRWRTCFSICNSKCKWLAMTVLSTGNTVSSMLTLFHWKSTSTILCIPYLPYCNQNSESFPVLSSYMLRLSIIVSDISECLVVIA